MKKSREHIRREAPPSRGAQTKDPRWWAQSEGAPLDPAVRGGFEARFGHDFGDVRVHADAEADRAARDFDTPSFAVGEDVYFRSGAYEPALPASQYILAHELAHTVDDPLSPASDDVELRLSDPESPAERRVQRDTERVMSGATPQEIGTAGAAESGPATVHRFSLGGFDIGKQLSGIGSAASNMIGSVTSGISGLGGGVGDLVGGLGPLGVGMGAPDWGGGSGGGLADIVNSVGHAAAGTPFGQMGASAAGGFGDIFSTIGGGLVGGFGGLASGMGGIAGGIGGGIAEGIAGLTGGLTGGISGAVGGLVGGLGDRGPMGLGDDPWLE